MAEIPRKFDIPIWLRKFGITLTLATLSYVVAACTTGELSQAGFGGECDSVPQITLSIATDELLEVAAGGEIVFDFPECGLGIDVDGIRNDLSIVINNEIPQIINIGGHEWPEPEVDIRQSTRYVDLRQIPRRLQAQVIEDQGLIIVPISILIPDASGTVREAQSLIVVDELLRILNANLVLIEPGHGSNVGSGYATSPNLDETRIDQDALLFAIGCTLTVVGGGLGTAYVKRLKEARYISQNQSGGRIARGSSTRGGDHQIHYHDYSNEGLAAGPYKAGDVIKIDSRSLGWEGLGHNAKAANTAVNTIGAVLGLVHFTNPEFRNEIDVAVANANALVGQYGDMGKRIEIEVTINEETAEALNRAVADQYSFPPPTTKALEGSIVARQVNANFETGGSNATAAANAVMGAGAPTLNTIADNFAINIQVGKTMRNIASHSQALKDELEHSRRVDSSILPDNVSDVD